MKKWPKAILLIRSDALGSRFVTTRLNRSVLQIHQLQSGLTEQSMMTSSPRSINGALRAVLVRFCGPITWVTQLNSKIWHEWQTRYTLDFLRIKGNSALPRCKLLKKRSTVFLQINPRQTFRFHTIMRKSAISLQGSPAWKFLLDRKRARALHRTLRATKSLSKVMHGSVAANILISQTFRIRLQVALLNIRWIANTTNRIRNASNFENN